MDNDRDLQVGDKVLVTGNHEQLASNGIDIRLSGTIAEIYEKGGFYAGIKCINLPGSPKYSIDKKLLSYMPITSAQDSWLSNGDTAEFIGTENDSIKNGWHSSGIVTGFDIVKQKFKKNTVYIPLDSIGIPISGRYNIVGIDEEVGHKHVSGRIAEIVSPGTSKFMEFLKKRYRKNVVYNPIGYLNERLISDGNILKIADTSQYWIRGQKGFIYTNDLFAEIVGDVNSSENVPIYPKFTEVSESDIYTHSQSSTFTIQDLKPKTSNSLQVQKPVILEKRKTDNSILILNPLKPKL